MRITGAPGEVAPDYRAALGQIRPKKYATFCLADTALSAGPTEPQAAAAIGGTSREFGEAIWKAEHDSDVTGKGVLYMLEATRLYCGDDLSRVRFHQASSSEMFGKGAGVPQRETTLLWPRSPYGVAKVFGHYMSSARFDVGMELPLSRLLREGGALRLGLVLDRRGEPVHARHGVLGRVPAHRRSLRPRRASLGLDQTRCRSCCGWPSTRSRAYRRSRCGWPCSSAR